MICSNCSIVRWWKRRVLEGRKNLSIVVFPSLSFSSLLLLPSPFLPFPFPLPFPLLFLLQPLSSSLHRRTFSTTSGDRSLGGSTGDGSPWRPQTLSLTFLVLFVPQAWWPFLELLVSEYIHQSANYTHTFYIEICAYFVNWSIFANLQISL